MALHNPPSLYTGGAERLNSQPEVNLYAQLLQRKLAREQALDEYERNRIDRMNEKGVRDQDREGLDKRVLGLKKTFQANKAAIRKGNTPEAYAYEKEFRNTSAYISHSVDRTARSIASMKHREERIKMGRMMPEGFWEKYQAHELPIDAEGSASIDLTEYISKATPKYDQTKSMKLLSGVKRVPSDTRYEEIPGQPDLRKQIKEYKFDDDGKDAIRAVALNEYDNDEGFASHVQSVVNDPSRRGRLEKVFEDNYKTKPRVLPEGFQDYAVAVKLDELQPTLIEAKDVADWPYRTAVNQANSMKKIAANQRGFGGPLTGNQFDTIDLSKYGNPKDGRVTIKKEDMPEGVKAILKSGGYDIQADKYYEVELDGEGKVKTVRPLGSGNRPRGIISRVDMDNAQKKWNTESQKSPQPQFGEKSEQQFKSEYKYNGKIWPIQKIKKAAIQSGISVEQYLKQFGFQ